MITMEELLQGRDKKYPNDFTDEIKENLEKLLPVMNTIRAKYGKPMIVNSGWRPSVVNEATPGAAKNSAHCQGLACDIADPDGEVKNWVLKNLDLMQELGIYLEDFRWTPNWVHFGLRKPASGKRIFVPSANRATAPDRWDGKYDEKYND
jgi:hypothetical protein